MGDSHTILTNSRSGSRLVQKMFELEEAYKEINNRDRELGKYRKLSNDFQNELTQSLKDKEREITKLEYMVSKYESQFKVAKGEAENAKRELKNEKDGRQQVEKRFRATEKENKELKIRMGSVRVKLGVAQANVSVGKHETDELRKASQDNQILIARLEERLSAANQEIERLRNPFNPESAEEAKRKLVADKKELKRLRVEVDRLQEQHTQDLQRVKEKEEELDKQKYFYQDKIDTLESNMELAELNVRAERSAREAFESQNQELRLAKTSFDEQIREFKVKLGISQAGKNVNQRQAELLRQKDEQYKKTLRSLEQQLKLANAELERNRALLSGKTAMSIQEHASRVKKPKIGIGVNTFSPPRGTQFGSPSGGINGWTPAGRSTGLNSTRMNSTGLNSTMHTARSGVMSNTPGRSRVSLSSVNSNASVGASSARRSRSRPSPKESTPSKS